MKTVRVKDNSELSKESFLGVPQTVNRLVNKTLDQLEKEGVFVFPSSVKSSEDLTAEQYVLQSVNESYRTGNVMGFLGYGDERLVIDSRFSTDSNDFFLQYMLERVLDYPNVFDLEAESDSKNQVLDLLMFLFSRYLKTAVRKGLFKTYIRVNYNDGNPNGHISVARHIEENIPFVGNVAYSRREYSYDNYLTELIRHTIELIKSRAVGRRLLSTVKDEVKLIVEATEGYKPYDRQKILAENKKNTVRHAYFREYRALQHLCILILQSQKQELGTGINRVYGVLFDGAWLWEEYINLIVGDIFYHPMNKAEKGVQKLFFGGVGHIYPDFISRNAEERIIADAKYKPIKNIGNADYFQVLAYMMRFEAKKGFYFYPESAEAKALSLWLNRGSTYEKNVYASEDVCVVKHGLRIPSGAKDYREFSAMMRDSERAFRACLT